MNWIAANIKWVMLVSGLLTCSMIYAAIAPQAALRSTFGASLEGPLAEIVVRNWGALITLVGAMLIYGAYHPAVRRLAVCIAGASKIFFIGLVLTYGQHYLSYQAGLSIAVDAVIVILFALYLLGRREPEGAMP